MDYEKLFALAKPYLEKNDLGPAHTVRVLAIARNNFAFSSELSNLTVASIILHDIGGSTIKEQYEKGPAIASLILQQMGAERDFVEQVCHIVGTHHEHPKKPIASFRILYDSDKLVMFSPEEFPIYDESPEFDWNKIVNLIYSNQGKNIAKTMLKQRRNEKHRTQPD